MKASPSYKDSAYKRWLFLCLFMVFLIAVLVLVGWQFDIERFKYPIPGLVGMNPATALSFILLGIAFFFVVEKKYKNRYIGYLLITIVIITSLLKLASAFIPSLPEIDSLLYREKIILTPLAKANSMALTTGISFVLTGISLLLINYETSKKRIPSHYISLAVSLFAFFSLLGYLYGAPEFNKLVEHFPMAVHTAACFVLLSIAILLANPYKGITKEFTITIGGNLAGRILLSSAIFIPVLVGELRTYLLQRHFFSPQLTFIFFVCTLVIFFCSIIFYFLTQLNRKELLRKETEDKLRTSEEIFRSLVSSVRDYAIIMLDVNGNVITWNKGAESINGYSEEEIKGKNVSVFYTEEDQKKDLMRTMLSNAKKYGRFETQGWRVRKDGSGFWADVVITALYNQEGILTGYAKVTRDFTEYKRAKDLLSRFNEELQMQIGEKTNELEEITSQLRQLSAFLQTAREEERKNIAREIHDELGQMLVGLRMDVVWLRKKMTTNDEAIKKRFESALELLNATRQTMRRIATDLHPAVLSDLGLVSALTLLAKEFEKRSGIKVNFTVDIGETDDLKISPDISISLYRMFQESLTNVAKHANAKEVNSYLVTDDNRLILNIIDNGTGFDIKQVSGKRTLGLISIRERVLMLNGQYEIHSLPGDGTSIKVIIPIKFI